MPIEIYTTIQKFEEHGTQDIASNLLAALLNQGWQIVTLTHHAAVENEGYTNTGTSFYRIVTLKRQTQTQVPMLPKDQRFPKNFVDKQRVVLMASFSDDDMPLDAGDLGYVVKAQYEGDEDGVLFDRYDSVSYSRKAGGVRYALIDFCQPVPEEGK